MRLQISKNFSQEGDSHFTFTAMFGLKRNVSQTFAEKLIG